MEKKIVQYYKYIILIFFVSCLFLQLANQANPYYLREDHGIKELDADSKKSLGDDKWEYTYKIPVSCTDEEMFSFQTNNLSVMIYIDNKPIYSLEERDGLVRTTGRTWNTVSMKKDYSGKILNVRLKSIYEERFPDPHCYFGSYTALDSFIYYKNIYYLIIEVILVLYGLFLLLNSILVMQSNATNYLKYLATVLILMGVWRICENPWINMIIYRSISLSYINHFCLFLLPVPFILFLKGLFKDWNQKPWNTLCTVSLIMLFIQTVLQTLSIYDLHEMLWMVHLNLIIITVMTFVYSIKALRSNHMEHQMRLYLIALIILHLLAITEVVIYYWKMENHDITQFGLLIYALIVGKYELKREKVIKERVEKTEKYRRLAYTDELTGLHNRTAFELDMKKTMEELSEMDKNTDQGMIIYMFDTNNLKQCNDTFGHEKGDQYLKLVADMINSIFGEEGRCYRIGGDEFAVLCNYENQKQIDIMIGRFHTRIQEENKENFVVPIGIAVGYDIYFYTEEKTIWDAKDLADQMMYLNKRNLKSEQNSIL